MKSYNVRLDEDTSKRFDFIKDYLKLKNNDSSFETVINHLYYQLRDEKQ